MRIAILIMSTEKEPSTRNIEAMKETMVKQTNENQFRHSYDFFEYTYAEESACTDEVISCGNGEYKNYYNMRIGGKESVYHTFEKTYVAYKYLLDNENTYGKYDRFVRINISCYLNMRLLDRLIDQTKEDCIYANALNTFVNIEGPCCNELYARGDFYIISRNTLKEVIKSGKQFMHCDTALESTRRINITHVDDTLFGYMFILYAGSRYFEKLQMIKYNFLPMTSDNADYVKAHTDKLAISTRVKTTPPNMLSGYSWDDNNWRLHDPMKMKIVHEFLKNENYENVKLEDVLVSPLQERETLFVQRLSMRPSQIISMKQ